MNSREMAANPSKFAEARVTTAAPAVVEIAGFPQVLHTRSYGDPDTLFVPLLDAAREAQQMVERLASHGENKAAAIRLSAMQLASILLRDSGFSLMARGMSQENVYTVDLDAGTFLVRTRLYAVVSRRMSFFRVEIAGKIADGVFVVRNPVLGSVIAQVDEEQVRRPSFFSSSLAQDCLRAQMEQERFGRVEETVGSEVHGEVRLLLAVNGNKVPVSLRQKEDGGRWDIVDGRRQEWVGTLSTEVETSLSAVVRFVQEQFAKSGR